MTGSVLLDVIAPPADIVGSAASLGLPAVLAAAVVAVAVILRRRKKK